MKRLFLTISELSGLLSHIMVSVNYAVAGLESHRPGQLKEVFIPSANQFFLQHVKIAFLLSRIFTHQQTACIS